MKKQWILSSLALACLGFAATASAQTAPAAAPAAAKAPEPDFTLSYNVGVVTDYRYRGISQTRLKPALQGGADFAHKDGAYLGTWLSSIEWIKDAGGGSSVEWDIYGGYKGKVGGMDYDVGVLAYQYNNNKLTPSANTTEIYGALTSGIVTAKYSHSVTNLFGFADSKSSGYLEVATAFDMGNGLTVTPHLGYQKVTGSGNGKFSYTDFSLTAAKDLGNGMAVSLALVSTDAPASAYASPSGKGLGKSALVLGAKYSF